MSSMLMYPPPSSPFDCAQGEVLLDGLAGALFDPLSAVERVAQRLGQPGRVGTLIAHLDGQDGPALRALRLRSG